MVRPTRMVLLLGSVGVLGAVALTGSNILARARDAAQVEALRLGAHAAALAQLELQARLREVEARAATAASLNPVRALASQRVDERTLRDAFETEAWWRSFRDEFRVQLLLLGPERYEFGRKDLGSALRTDGLVRDAMQRSPASGALRVEDTVLLVSAASVDVPVDPTRRPAIVVLAQPLTARDLARAAGRAGGAVAVTGTDRRLLVMSGSAEEEQRLRDLLARPVPVLEGAIASAGSAPLGEGLSLWASADTRLASEGARRPAQTVVAVLWLLGLAACAVLVAGALRRPRDEHVQLEAMREELQRTPAELERRPADAQAGLEATREEPRRTPAELEQRPVEAQAALETTREEPRRTPAELEQRPVEAQAALETTREELQRTRAELEQRPVEAQAALETTREELQRTRAELEQRAANEQALLEATREELQRTRAELERGPDEHMLLEA
ncbi:MAG TPA: hypothetical protein VFI53_04115, partial [Myxococcaceae bacterium]|nr:hypothetical protein [Myxococcaceae bacterium]